MIQVSSKQLSSFSFYFTVVAVVSVCWFLFLRIFISIVDADTTVVSDTFTRTTSSGWGTADTGGSYTLTGSASDFATDGSVGTITAPTASTSRSAVLTNVSNQDVDITYKIKTDKVASGISQEYFVIGRYIDSSNMYRGKIRFTPSNTVTVQGGKVVGGTETLLGVQQTISGLTHSVDTYINIRMKLTGVSPTTIEMKAWLDGSAEPGAWDFTTTDSEAVLQDYGSVGLRLNMPSSTSNAPIVATYDNFTVTTADVADSQSGLTLLSDTFTRTESSSWGTSNSGGEYLITSGTASDFDTTGTTGTINSPTASVSRSIIMNNSLQQDLDFKFKVKLDKVPTGTAAEVFWQGRRVDPSNLYRGKIRMTTAGAVTLQATKVIGGTETALGTQESIGITFDADEYVYIRSQVTGVSPTTIKMKAWIASETEPVTWQYTTTDSESVLQDEGSIGFRTNMPSSISNAPILATFDDISVTTNDAQINDPTAPAQEGTTIANDTYTRTTSSGWGTADTGGAYTITSGTSSSFSTNGTQAVIENPTSGTSRAISLEDLKQQDVDIKFKVKIDTIPTGNAAEAFWVARRLNPSNQYRGKIRFTTSNSVTVQASNVINGTETLLGSQASTGIAYSADTYIWVRTQIVGTHPTTIKMKAWLVSGTEPVTWQYIVTDYGENTLQTAGSIGVRTNLPSSVSNAPINFTFDDLTATTTDIDIYDPATAPSPSPTPTPPSAVSVSINLSGSPTTSRLRVGVTHTQESSNTNGDTDAINRGKDLLQNGLYYQNQHVMGFGANNLWDDPSKDVADWNWDSLDTRVQLMRDTGATPILTLCCAPTWMVDSTWYPTKYDGSNTDWGQLEEAPLDIYESDYAYMVQKIVERYDGVTLDSNNVAFPKILRFQVWNEMKGLWDHTSNGWNATKYNRMYGLIYDAIKSVRSDAIIGGPYVRVSKYLYPNGSQTSSLSDSNAYGTVDQRDLDMITSWLSWINSNRDGDGNLKAQFIAVDGTITTKDVSDGTFPTDIWSATKFYSDLNGWMNTEMTNVIGAQLPIWWSEDYVGKVNGDSALITAETYQPSALATMLYRHVNGGTSTSLRWGPEEQISSAGVAQGNKQNLFNSTQFSGGGQAYENYNIYKYFRDYFSDGTAVYPTTVSPSTEAITALASTSKTLLINKTSSSITVDLSTGSASSQHVVNAYSVKLVDTPSSVAQASSTTASSTQNSSCPQGYSFCPNVKALSLNTITSEGELDKRATLLYYPAPGSMDLVMKIRLQNPFLLPSGVPLPWQQGFNIVSDIFSASAVSAFNGYPVTQLETPATIILHYDTLKLYGRSPRELRIAYYDTKTKRWKIIPFNTVLDLKNKTLANTTDKMTYFAIVYMRNGRFAPLKI